MPNEKYLNPSTISIPNSESFSILMGVVDSIGTGKYTKVFDSIELSGRKAILSDSIDSIGSIESIELVAKEDTPSDLIEPIEPTELLDKEAMLSKIVGALGNLAVSWSEYRRLPDDTGSEAVGVSDKGDVVIAVFEDKGNTTISVVDSSFLGGDDNSSNNSSNNDTDTSGIDSDDTDSSNSDYSYDDRDTGNDRSGYGCDNDGYGNRDYRYDDEF